MDWGVVYPNVNLVENEYLMNTYQPPNIPGDEERVVKSCEFQERRIIILTGICLALGTCRVVKVNYIGSFCDGQVQGATCQAEV